MTSKWLKRYEIAKQAQEKAFSNEEEEIERKEIEFNRQWLEAMERDNAKV